MPGYVPTLEDLRLQEVYGEWVYGNPGTHLDGGIKDDLAWQAWWRDLVVMPSRRYAALRGEVGRRFVGTLGAEMQGVWDRRWNSERFIIFQTVILQQARHVTISHAIRRLIAWDAVTWRARYRITVWKAMNRSEFHRRSRTPCISAPSIPTNRWLTFPPAGHSASMA